MITPSESDVHGVSNDTASNNAPLPFNLQEAVNKGLYDTERDAFTDPRTGERLTLSQAAARQPMDPDVACVYDRKDERATPLERPFLSSNSPAATPSVVIPSEPLIAEQSQTHGLDAERDAFTDPRTGERLTLSQAAARQPMDPDVACVYDRKDERATPLERPFLSSNSPAATPSVVIPSEPLIAEQSQTHGLGTSPSMTAAPSDNMNQVGRITLTDFLNNWDSKSGTGADPRNDDRMTLRDGLRAGLVKPAGVTALNTLTGQYVSLPEAIASGLLDATNGLLTDARTGVKIDLLEAMRRGLLHCEPGVQSDAAAVSPLEDSFIHSGGQSSVSFIGLRLSPIYISCFNTFKSAFFSSNYV